MTATPNLVIPSDWIVPLVMVAAAVVLVVIALKVAHGHVRRRKASTEQVKLTINLSDFGEFAVPQTGPQLRFFNVPTRLALVVMAPVGRDGRLPDREIWPNLIDRAIPQVRGVIDAHHTELRPWPNQLSTEGFCKKFFHALQLPNEQGKGSKWSAVAGRFSALNNRFLVGLLLRADEPNNLGQITVERDAQWLDIFRIDA